jgi:hypothetical protein
MLRSVLEDLSIQLSEVSCIHFDEEKAFLYLGMITGEVVSLKLHEEEGRVTIRPRLFLSPGFEIGNNPVVAMTVADMPFSLMTVVIDQSG